MHRRHDSVLKWFAVAFLAGACSAPVARTTPGIPVRHETAAAAPTPTHTPLPARAGATSTPAASEGRYAFHVNFVVEETGSCNSSVTCDMALIPRAVVYIRGDVRVKPDGSADGAGVLRYLDVAGCQTLLTDVSSCQASPAADGSFTISGKALPAKDGNDRLELLLHLEAPPQLDAAMTTSTPSGAMSIPIGSTYAWALKNLLEQAKLFEMPFEVAPIILSGDSPSEQRDSAWRVFQGVWEMKTQDGSAAHTYRGLGGLFFISPGMPMP